MGMNRLAHVMLVIGVASVVATSAAATSDSPRTRREMRDDARSCGNRSSVNQVISALAACDRALSDIATNRNAWQSRAEFLQTRALAQFFRGQDSAALESLTLSDSSVEGHDPLIHSGSVGLGNALIRALVYNRTGRREEALALLDDARRVRRYSLVVQASIDRVQLSIDRDMESFRHRLAGRMDVDPSSIRSLFYQRFLTGDLAGADAISGIVQFVQPKMIDGWTVTGGSDSFNRLSEEIEFHYLTAYIRAALGNRAGSEAAFARATAQIDAYVGQEPRPTPGRPVRASTLRDWQARASSVSELRRAVLIWRQAIIARLEITFNASPDTLSSEKMAALRHLPIIPDLINVIMEHHPASRAELRPIANRIRDDFERSLLVLSSADLIELLPEVETLAQYPRFGRAADGIMLGPRELGYSQAPVRDDDGDTRTVRFGTQSGSRSTADELVMLAAATYALREDKDSFILLARTLTNRTMRITGPYGGGGTEVDFGVEAAVVLVFINSSAFPEQWEPHRSRLVLASDVIASVGARQDAIGAMQLANRATERNRSRGN